ncbi:MAG: hydrolase [Candidatus Rokubacteria bacterium]|nr:hydrolase [Candidatus Rokubacteria bacterium]
MIKPYLAFALQTATYGCKHRRDIKHNIAHLGRQIDAAMYISQIEYPTRLIALPEGALQGFYDEHARLDHQTICRDIAIEVPGEETALLAEKAKQWDVYIIAQAKVLEPSIAKDRFFNAAFIISPSGEIIHKHHKSRVFIAEGTTTPFDVHDAWTSKVGDGLQSFYPVADTPIGRIGTLICYEGRFPESGRLLAMNGAEIIYRATQVEFHTTLGYWELQNRGHALNNCCYVVSPNNGPKYFSTEDQTPSATGGAGGKSMIINYRGQIMCEVDGVNVSYAAAIINVEELRSYRTESRYNPLVALIPELWSRLYAKAAERFPWPKNLYAERALGYEERKATFDAVADQMVKNGVLRRPGTEETA